MEQTTNKTELLRAFSNQMADAVERVSSSVVLVNGRQRQAGSGIVYSSNLVLTAAHVLEREDDLSIQTHDKRTLAARFIGRDSGTDLAVLQVAGLDISTPTFAEAPGRVGQLVLAVGRTASEGSMASSGVISAIGGPLRTRRGTTLERYIRTDATPYPGFSGGPLIDVQGHVLGILTTGLISNLALAIPQDIARNIAEILSKQGHIKRGYLGISSQFIQIPDTQKAGRSQEYGLLLVRVDEHSPAQQGGLLIGDILISLDGHTITDSEDLPLLLAGERVGKTIPVEVIRTNTLHTFQVTIAQRP